MSDAKSDGIFEIFVIFLVELRFFFFRSLLHVPATEKNPVGTKKTVFRPFSEGENTPKKKRKKKKTRLVLLVTVRKVVPRRAKGFRVILYDRFQRPVPLSFPHPGMLHTEVVIAQLAKCL